MMDAIDKAQAQQIADIDTELNAMYKKSSAEIRKKSKEFDARFKAMDEKKRDLVDAGELDKAEYDRWRNTQVFQSNHYKNMEKAICNEMAQTNQIAVDYVNGQSRKAFSYSYNSFGAGISSAVSGYDFELINSDSAIALSDVVAKELNVPKDTAWTQKKIRSQVAQGIIQGESVQAIANRLESIGASEGYAAQRMARTMIGGAVNAGKQAQMERAESRGIVMGKQWKAFHDARTRDTHILLDNVIIDVDRTFDNGCKYPRDPTGRPEEICNCRCTMSGKVMGRIDLETGEFIQINQSVDCTEMPEGTFPDGYTYEQWKADAQQRIDKRAMRQALAENETPAYSNKLLQKEETKKQIIDIYEDVSSIEEAEEYISRYVDKNQFGSVGISYDGISVDVANDVNRAITKIQENFDVGKLGGIVAPKGNTKMGMKVDGATAAYSPVRNSLILNRKSLKNKKTAMEALGREKKVVTDFIENPQNYDKSKMSKRVLDVLERSAVSGRGTVPETVEDVVCHELGHSLERQVKSHPNWAKAKSKMPESALSISGYAGESESEYIAESFASYMKGEDLIDTEMRSIFDGLRRKQ